MPIHLYICIYTKFICVYVCAHILKISPPTLSCRSASFIHILSSIYLLVRVRLFTPPNVCGVCKECALICPCDMGILRIVILLHHQNNNRPKSDRCKSVEAAGLALGPISLLTWMYRESINAIKWLPRNGQLVAP